VHRAALAGERLQVRAPLRVPEANSGIISAAGERASIGRKGDALDVVSMPASPEQGAALQVPQLDGPIPAPRGERISTGLKARARTVSLCACQARCSIFPSSRHTRTSPRLLPAAQYCPVLLMATAQEVSKASVKTVSRRRDPESVASCISTPCRDTPRRARRERSRPRKSPRNGIVNLVL
jgi:hypothetical protein